jgi:hypothetical protein
MESVLPNLSEFLLEKSKHSSLTLNKKYHLVCVT